MQRWQILIAFLAVTVAFIVGLVWLAHLNNDTQQLSKENAARIHDIQQARVESCERTYEGVREIFKPFFRPASKQTKLERRNQRKFNRRVDALKDACPHQTGVHG